MDGFQVPDTESAVSEIDVLVSSTGNFRECYQIKKDFLFPPMNVAVTEGKSVLVCRKTAMWAVFLLRVSSNSVL